MATNSPDSEKKSYERSFLKVTESVMYCCQYCGNGAETFDKAFPKGCATCGAPAEEYDATKIIRNFPDLDRSFFVVNAGDTQTESAEFVQAIKAAGGKAVTLQDVLPNGVATSEIATILQTVTKAVPWVVFVPSPQLEEGETNGFILDMVMSDTLRTGIRKTFPLYVDSQHMDGAPMMLLGTKGVLMKGEDDDGMQSSFEFFKKGLPDMIDKINRGSDTRSVDGN